MDHAAAIRVGRTIRIIGDHFNGIVLRRAFVPPGLQNPFHELQQHPDVPFMITVGCLSFLMGWCLCKIVNGPS